MEFADVEAGGGEEEADEDGEDDVVGLLEAGEDDHADEEEDVDVEQEDEPDPGGLVVLLLRTTDEDEEAGGADQEQEIYYYSQYYFTIHHQLLQPTTHHHQHVLSNDYSSLMSSSSKFSELWSNFYKIGFTILVAFLSRTSSFLLTTTMFSFSDFYSNLLRMGVTLRFLFFMINGCPSNCSILHMRSLLTLRTAARLLNYPQQLGAEKRVTSFLSQINSQPSSTTWWDRQMRSNQCFLRKKSMTFLPQQKLMPRQKLSLHPSLLGLGSDHRMSATTRLQLGSTGLFMLLMQETCLMRGLSPPCTQKMRSETTAATGQKLKLSDIVFQALMLSLLLHSSQKPQSLLSQLDSWFPLRKKKLLGHLILQAISRQMHSRDCLPLSTQSPRNKQFFLVGSPKSLKIVRRSLNCPWVSPQIWMGACSSRSMGCSMMMLLNMAVRPSTSQSLRLKDFSLYKVCVSFIIISSMLIFFRLSVSFILDQIGFSILLLPWNEITSNGLSTVWGEVLQQSLLLNIIVLSVDGEQTGILFGLQAGSCDCGVGGHLPLAQKQQYSLTQPQLQQGYQDQPQAVSGKAQEVRARGQHRKLLTHLSINQASSLLPKQQASEKHTALEYP